MLEVLKDRTQNKASWSKWKLLIETSLILLPGLDVEWSYSDF